MKKLTNEQKINLRNKTKSEIERLEGIFSNVETLQLLDSFKNKFNVCESAYKTVFAMYEKCNNRNDKYLKIDMRQVPSALNFAGYSFGKKLLNELFGSKSNIKGCQTVKKLRDNITHGIDQKSVNEIKERKEELFGYMDDFLNAIKTFDK